MNYDHTFYNSVLLMYHLCTSFTIFENSKLNVISLILVYVNTYFTFIYISIKEDNCSLFYHKNRFIMFECDFQSTNILLLKMTENINQKHSRKKGYLINLREEHKVKQIPGHDNVAVN